MSSSLQAISLFPETRMWRVKGSPWVQHRCGGIATILVFLGLAAVLAVSLIGVFNRSQSIVTEQKQTSSTGVVQTITTNQSSQSNRPFMMAFYSGSGTAYSIISTYVIV
jgi:ABC-type phosphate transport system auxiliary subunit